MESSNGKQNVSHREILSRIEKLIHTKIRSYSVVEGGYTQATRLLCKTDTTSFFAKAGSTPDTCKYIQREIQVYRKVSGPFMPKVMAWQEHETEPILIIEDLSDHHWPPPWDDRQIDLVLSQLAIMHDTKTELEPFSKVHGENMARGSGWLKVAENPEPFLSIGIADEKWLSKSLPLLISNADNCRVEGNSLTHWDLRSDNICITKERAIFIDWNLACLSNPKLDLGFWLPSLAYEGGPLPDTILPDSPEIAAFVSGYFAQFAGLPVIKSAPRVRMVQQQQLETALPWAARALDLPPPVSC